MPSSTSTSSSLDAASPKIAVVIPCYKVKRHILDVIALIGQEVGTVYVVDDACPEASGQFVAENCRDPRVKILRHAVNGGVGAAVMTGYRAAIDDGATVIVKIDGDGQMDPRLLPNFVAPILSGEADYTKGNRYFDPEQLKPMPPVRLFGNAALSLLAKMSSGYWQSFDPNNGYTAIHAAVARKLPFHKISSRYFFETDMLFRLNIHRAVVLDIPMAACYGEEVSNLSIGRSIFEFGAKHMRNFFKRIVYNYYLRDASLASIELPLGILMALVGTTYGFWKYCVYSSLQTAAPAGTVIISTLLIVMGIQFILAFFSHDISNIPVRPLHKTRYFSDGMLFPLSAPLGGASPGGSPAVVAVEPSPPVSG